MVSELDEGSDVSESVSQNKLRSDHRSCSESDSSRNKSRVLLLDFDRFVESVCGSADGFELLGEGEAVRHGIPFVGFSL
jgi:hypothetical protein